MSTITTINAADQITASRTVINTNFSNLNTDKVETSVLDVDTTLASNSDLKVATQKAVKAYVDAGGNVNASTTTKGIVEEATAAEVASGASTGATGARLFMNPSTAGTKFITTQVFSGTSTAGTFTNLDLSSVVGTLQRMVMLRVKNLDVTTRRFYFRKNGETMTTNLGVSAGGTTYTGLLGQNEIAYVFVPTDSTGIVQWTEQAAAISCQVNVEAYW